MYRISPNRKRQRQAKNAAAWGKSLLPTIFLDGNDVKYEQNLYPVHKLLRGGMMTWWILIGFFAAFGMVCAGLTLYAMVLHYGHRDEKICILTKNPSGSRMDYIRWLRGTGILRCRILVLDAEQLWDELERTGIDITSREITPEKDRSGSN